MGNILAGSEIVELGVQIEKNGRDFYNTLVAQSKSPQAREVFKYLAGEEEKHIVIFKRILEKIEKYEPPEAYPGEYFSYMNALASEHIFTQKDKGEEVAKSITGEREAILRGIGFEKDSIIFYEGMKKVVPQDEWSILDELIIQEQNHLRQLSELKNKL